MTPDITNPPIIVAAGKCPHMLSGISDDEILEWVRTLRGSVSKMLTVSAFKYWVRQSFDIRSDEHRHVCSRIDKLVKEPKGYVSFV